MNVTEIPLKVGQSTTKVTVEGLSEGDSVRGWSSDNPKIVSVSPSGKIKGKKKGSASVQVELASGKRASILVRVQKKDVKTKQIRGVEKRIVLKKGETLLLKPELYPITSIDKIKYKTSAKKIVSVTGSGRLKAKQAGSARVTITAGKKKFICKVIVE